MKKLLGVLLAIAMSWPVNAAVLKNVEVVGEIQTIASDVRHDIQYQNIEDETVSLYNRGAWTRAMAGLSADVVEDVTANILFQYAYAWGTNNDGLVGFGASGDDEVRLINANVTLHNLFCAFDLTVGRQFYGDEDSAVMYLGPNHYNAETGYLARAIDAAKLVYADDMKSFTMIAGTIYDSETKDAKFDLYGADFKLRLADVVTAQVYGYDIKSSGADRQYGLEYFGIDPYDEEGNLREDSHHGFYGAKLGADMEAFRVSAEYARNFGGKRLVKEHNPTGHMFKFDIAADINALTARGTFYYANENFWSFGNYTPGLLVGHSLGGDLAGYSYFDDEFKSGGMRMFNLGFDMKAFEKWVFSIDGYAFQGTHGNHSATWEADLTAKYNHNEYVQLFAGIGYAKYGNDWSVFAKEDYSAANEWYGRRDNVKGQVGMLIKF